MVRFCQSLYFVKGTPFKMVANKKVESRVAADMTKKHWSVCTRGALVDEAMTKREGIERDTQFQLNYTFSAVISLKRKSRTTSNRTFHILCMFQWSSDGD